MTQLRRVPIALLWPLSALLVSGCQNEPGDVGRDAVVAAANPDGKPPGEIRVDPQLLETGRIRLFEVQSNLPVDTRAVPGEVVSDPEGEAHVGGLLAGRVRTLSADVGDEVKKGAVLALLDAPELARTRAQLASANAQLTLAQSQLARQEELRAENATSARALDQAAAAVSAARAQVDAARALLVSWGVPQAGAVGSQLALTSPISGVVAARSATLGGAVRSDETLFRIIDPERVVILAQWPEGRLAVPPPQSILEVRARWETRGTAPCQAVVETRGGIVNAATRTVTLRLRPKQPCEGLLPGAYVNILAQAAGPSASPTDPGPEGGSAPNAVHIPRLALVDVRGVPTVFVAEGPPGRFVARTVLSEPSGAEYLVVTSGLAAGEKVAEKGVILLKGELLRDVLGGE